MQLSSRTVSRLRELREDLRKIYDPNNRIEFVLSQEIAPDDPGEPAIETLPLPTSSTWRIVADNWKEEAFFRRVWWRFSISRESPEGDAKDKLHWHPCIYSNRSVASNSGFWLLLPRLSLVCCHDDFSRIWNFFPFEKLVNDVMANNDAIWLFLICEIAWAHPAVITSHTSHQAQPAEANGLYGQAYEAAMLAHHQRIGLDRVQKEFGIRETPTNCIWVGDDMFPPDCKAIEYVHWWTEFDDLIGASIEAIDWLCSPKKDQNSIPPWEETSPAKKENTQATDKHLKELFDWRLRLEALGSDLENGKVAYNGMMWIVVFPDAAELDAIAWLSGRHPVPMSQVNVGLEFLRKQVEHFEKTSKSENVLDAIDHVRERLKTAIDIIREERVSELPVIPISQSEVPINGNNVKDGPFGANKFRWKGREFDMPPKPWGVVSAVWEASDRTRDVIEVAMQVWGDELKAQKPLTNACSTANGLFERHNVPITLHRRKVKTATCITLEIRVSTASAAVPN